MFEQTKIILLTSGNIAIHEITKYFRKGTDSIINVLHTVKVKNDSLIKAFKNRQHNKTARFNKYDNFEFSSQEFIDVNVQDDLKSINEAHECITTEESNDIRNISPTIENLTDLTSSLPDVSQQGVLACKLSNDTPEIDVEIHQERLPKQVRIEETTAELKGMIAAYDDNEAKTSVNEVHNTSEIEYEEKVDVTSEKDQENKTKKVDDSEVVMVSKMVTNGKVSKMDNENNIQMASKTNAIECRAQIPEPVVSTELQLSDKNSENFRNRTMMSSSLHCKLLPDLHQQKEYQKFSNNENNELGCSLADAHVRTRYKNENTLDTQFLLPYDQTVDDLFFEIRKLCYRAASYLFGDKSVLELQKIVEEKMEERDFFTLFDELVFERLIRELSTVDLDKSYMIEYHKEIYGSSPHSLKSMLFKLLSRSQITHANLESSNPTGVQFETDKEIYGDSSYALVLMNLHLKITKFDGNSTKVVSVVDVNRRSQQLKVFKKLYSGSAQSAIDTLRSKYLDLKDTSIENIKLFSKTLCTFTSHETDNEVSGRKTVQRIYKNIFFKHENMKNIIEYLSSISISDSSIFVLHQNIFTPSCSDKYELGKKSANTFFELVEFLFQPTDINHIFNADVNELLDLKKQTFLGIEFFIYGDSYNVLLQRYNTIVDGEQRSKYRLVVVTAEVFEDAMRQYQIEQYKVTSTNYFPKNCRMFLHIPVYKGGFINRRDTKDGALTNGNG